MKQYPRLVLWKLSCSWTGTNKHFLFTPISPFGFEKYEQTSFFYQLFQTYPHNSHHISNLSISVLSHSLSSILHINKPEICLILYLEIIDAESNLSCSKFSSGLLWTDYCCNCPNCSPQPLILTLRTQPLIFHIEIHVILFKTWDHIIFPNA